MLIPPNGVPQALSQANLQQQQMLANLPAMLASTNLRGYSRPPRRFHEHQYKNNNRINYTHGHFPHTGQQHLPQHQIQPLGPSPHRPPQHLPGTSNANADHHLHPSAGQPSLSRSVDASCGRLLAPHLERRSSWDGSDAANDLRAQYRQSSSVSEAGGDMQTTTAPTSPTIHGSHLPAFRQAFNPTYAPNFGGPADRQSRDHRSSFSHGYRSHSHAYNPGNYRGRPYRPSRSEQGEPPNLASLSPQAFPVSPVTLPMSQMPLPTPMSLVSQHHLGSPNTRSQHVFPSSSDNAVIVSPRLLNGPSHSPRPQEVQEEVLDASSVQFGNFDADLYSSEPTEMAGLGLFEDSMMGPESPNTSGSASLGSTHEDALPPGNQFRSTVATHVPGQQAEHYLPVRDFPSLNANANANANALRFYRPQLADIPSSPATGTLAAATQKKRSNPAAPASVLASPVQRPSRHGRRRSAGDEADLGIEDVTFFGKIPAMKDEEEREKAVIALTKDGAGIGGSATTPAREITRSNNAAHAHTPTKKLPPLYRRTTSAISTPTSTATISNTHNTDTTASSLPRSNLPSLTSASASTASSSASVTSESPSSVAGSPTTALKTYDGTMQPPIKEQPAASLTAPGASAVGSAALASNPAKSVSRTEKPRGGDSNLDDIPTPKPLTTFLVKAGSDAAPSVKEADKSIPQIKRPNDTVASSGTSNTNLASPSTSQTGKSRKRTGT